MNARKRKPLGLPGFIAVLLLGISLPFAVPTIIIGIIAAATPDDTWAKRELQSNWGIALPEPSSLIERHSEPSFNGDGVRIKVFGLTLDTPREGTIIDPADMGPGDLLTPRQVGDMLGAMQKLQPQHRVDRDSPAVTVRALGKNHDSDQIVLLYDANARLLHIYESYM